MSFIDGAMWNGEPAVCCRVRVVVGESTNPNYWHHHLVGTVRDAVRVEYGGVFYIDNENDRGVKKVTIGRGCPHYGHWSLPESSVEVKA